MRNITSLGERVAVAMADFNVHLSPPSTHSTLAAPTQSPPAAVAGCDAQKCPWWPYSNSKDFKANTALILVTLFCALIFALAFNATIRYFIRLHCRQRRQQSDANEKTEPGDSAEEQAAEIPALIYSDGMKLRGADTECIICLSEFAVGEKIRVLEKCNHGFHLQCIQQCILLALLADQIVPSNPTLRPHENQPSSYLPTKNLPFSRQFQLARAQSIT